MNKGKRLKLAEGVLAVLILLVLVGGGILYAGESREPKRDDGVERSTEEIRSEVPITVEFENKEAFTVARDRAVVADAPEKEVNTDAQATENHRYEIIPQRMTYAEAKAHCEGLGGHLATVTSREEYDRILDLAVSSGLKVLWLGAENTASGFEWVTGETFGFTAWMEGEPNNEGGNENYLVMFSVKERWVWSDVPSDLSPYYGADKVGMVCEWDG